MGKKKDRIKLPSRILGAKVPRDARKRINRLLKSVPAAQSRPIVAGAIAIAATLLAEKLEGPLTELLQRGDRGEGDRNGGRARPTSLARH